MARTKSRQRALARAKVERQIARRAAAARRRRQLQAGVGAGIAVVLLVIGVLWVTGVFEPDKTTPVASECTWRPHTGPEARDVGMPPTTGIAKSGTEVMTLTTNQGVIEIALDRERAPCAAASFAFLAGKQFFNGTPCHRLTNAGLFVLQCGDPSGTGAGGPGYRFIDENLPTADPTPDATASPSPEASPSPQASPSAAAAPAYRAGVVAMANSGPDTNGSQFFIVYRDSQLDPNYSVIGTVTKGLDVVEKIAAGGIAEGGSNANDGKPKLEVKIETLTVGGGSATPAPSPSGTGPPS